MDDLISWRQIARIAAADDRPGQHQAEASLALAIGELATEIHDLRAALTTTNTGITLTHAEQLEQIAAQLRQSGW